MICLYGKKFLSYSLSCSLILEYADGGNLQEYVEFLKLNNMLISEREALMIVIQIVKGLRALHKKKIIHRDLKVSAVLCHDEVCSLQISF